MNPRTKLILFRVLQAIPALAGVILVSFILTRMLPGDPAAYFAGPAATPESIAEIRAAMGLEGRVANWQGGASDSPPMGRLPTDRN